MIISYAGLTLDYVLTDDFSFDSVPADDAQTQYWHTKVGARVRAILHPNLAPVGNAAINGASPATILRDLKKVLKQHRQKLIISSDEGDTIVESPADGKTVDAKNGPIVKRCRVRRMSNACFEIDFEVETYIVDCNQRPGKFASHRFSDTIVIDDNFYTTRIRVGKVIVWSDGNTTNPDDVKADVIPPMRPNHVRGPIEWTILEDGLTARYRVVDREVYRLPPPGATKAQGAYMEESEVTMPWITVAAQLQLEGPPEVSQELLVAQALRIIAAKFGQAGLKEKSFAYGSTKVSADMWNNAVTVTSTAMLAKSAGQKLKAGDKSVSAPVFTGKKALTTPVPEQSVSLGKDGKPKDKAVGPTPAITGDKHKAKQSLFTDPCKKTPPQPT